MSPGGSLYFDGGWNSKALVALAVSGALSIGLSLAGAFGLMFNVGDWGWLIGASTGALVHVAASRAGRARAPGFA
jgi:NCS1 family nucleobase:cation symporter-1